MLASLQINSATSEVLTSYSNWVAAADVLGLRPEDEYEYIVGLTVCL